MMQFGNQNNSYPERLIIQLNTSPLLTRSIPSLASAFFIIAAVLFLLGTASADPPEADAIIAPTQGLEGVALQYSVSNVTDPDNDTVDTTWDFGDGSGYTSSESSFNTYHTFDNDGTYLVSLTMVDENGESNSTQWNVTIENRAPIIDSFTIPNQGEIGQTLSFSASVSDSDSVVGYWDFGEGTIIQAFDNPALWGGSWSVNHTFPNVGIYNVTLTVTDSDDASTQVTRIIEIIGPPDDRNNFSDYAIISFVFLYSFYSMWRRRRNTGSKD